MLDKIDAQSSEIETQAEKLNSAIVNDYVTMSTVMSQQFDSLDDLLEHIEMSEEDYQKLISGKINFLYLPDDFITLTLTSKVMSPQEYTFSFGDKEVANVSLRFNYFVNEYEIAIQFL